jgi:hypothetical protein
MAGGPILYNSCLIVRNSINGLYSEAGPDCMGREEISMRKIAVNQPVKNNRMEGALAALARSIARWTDKDGLHVTAISALALSRVDALNQPTSYMYEPSICLVAQGVKRVLLGDDTYVYDAHHYLITSVVLPAVVQVIKASRERPYLGLILKLDRREISQSDGGQPSSPAACAAIKPWNGDRRCHLAAAQRLPTVD